MKLTGHADFQLNQARNFVVEHLTALPSFLPEDNGRLIYVTTIGPDFGLYYGADSGWQKFGGTLAYLVSTYDYTYYNLQTTSIAPQTIRERTGISDKIVSPISGQIIMVEVTASLPLASGGVTVKPVINGTPSPAGDLDVLVDPSHPVFNKRIVVPEHPSFALSTGDFVGLQVVGQVASAPTEVTLKATVHVMHPIALEALESYDTLEFFYMLLSPSTVAASNAVFTTIPGYYAAKAGYLRLHSAAVAPTRAAGSIILTPTINSVPIADPRLTLTIDASNPTNHYKNVNKDPAFLVNAGDLVGVQLVSDAPLLPATGINVMHHLNIMYTA